jgi:transposase
MNHRHERKSRGRPTLLTAALKNRICGLLRDGCNIKTACNICGVGERTYYDWRGKGNAGEEPFAKFFSAVTRAREAHKANLVRRIVAAAKADWKAASWLLERQFPNEFARSEPRTILIERLPPVPSPEPETRPGKLERWFTPKSIGIPLDKKALDYLDTLRCVESQPLPRNGAE